MKKPFDSTLYLCAHCRGDFPFEKIRYANDGKRILCIDCYNNLARSSQLLKENMQKGKIEAKGSIAKGSIIAEEKPNPSIRQEIVKGIAKDDKVRLICVDCRYKFSFNKGSRIKTLCPYCNSSNLMNDNITTEKLIEGAYKFDELKLGKLGAVYKKYLY